MMVPPRNPSTPDALDTDAGLLPVNGEDYWLYHVQPDRTGTFAAGINFGIADLSPAPIGIDVNEWSMAARESLRLPLRERGCGLREAVDRRLGQLIGGTA